jgi:methylated-DNA-protein-cysteine methyltransferase-like protein
MPTDKLTINEIIWQIVASIPKGSVATYGQIAKLAGYPSHARYVGATLKKLPEDSVLPWHRVINAKGELSFPVDGQQYQKQRALLEAEGIEFKSFKLSLSRYGLHR